MSESHLILLLQLVFAGADVDALLARGLEFSQIGMLMTEGLERGLLIDAGGSLRLTESGTERMQRNLTDLQGRRRDGGWISPFDQFRIEKSGLDDIYLPSEETAYSLGQGH